MPNIRIAVDESLLTAAEEFARRQGITLSALTREALRSYLDKSRRPELEARDREGYLRFPDTEADLQGWEEGAAWPSL